MRILVDTSSWVEALRNDGREDVRERVRDLVVNGDAVLCDMVLLELWNGARGEKERRDLSRLHAELEVIPTGDETWVFARGLARRARETGVTVPATDLLVVACAATNGAGIEAVDDHIMQAWRIAAGMPQG